MTNIWWQGMSKCSRAELATRVVEDKGAFVSLPFLSLVVFSREPKWFEAQPGLICSNHLAADSLRRPRAPARAGSVAASWAATAQHGSSAQDFGVRLAVGDEHRGVYLKLGPLRRRCLVVLCNLLVAVYIWCPSDSGQGATALEGKPIQIQKTHGVWTKHIGQTAAYLVCVATAFRAALRGRTSATSWPSLVQLTSSWAQPVLPRNRCGLSSKQAGRHGQGGQRRQTQAGSR